MRPVPKSRVRVQNKLVDEDHVNDHHVDGDNNDVNDDIQVSSQSREMSQSLVVTSQSGLPLHRSSSFHQVIMSVMMIMMVMMMVVVMMIMMVMMLTSQGGLPLHMFTSFH